MGVKTSDRRRIENLLIQKARRLDLPSLLAALDWLGYPSERIQFQGNQNPTSTESVIDALEFHESNKTAVCRLNLGLGGTHGLLPGYFLSVSENLPEPEQFHRFLEFFESGLLSDYAVAQAPERHHRWKKITKTHFEMLGLGSCSTLTWLFGQVFPELAVQVERSSVPSRTDAHALVVGGVLNGSSVLGSTHDASRTGFLITLFAEDEQTDNGASWWRVAQDRVRSQVLHHLEGLQVFIHVQLVVEDHSSWAKLSPEAQLGYDRVGGEGRTHTVSVYQDGT